MKKRLLSLFLVLCTLLALIPCGVLAEDSQDEDIQDNLTVSINPYGGAEDDIDTIDWYNLDDVYYFFLPADFKPSKLTVFYSSTEELYIDGVPVESGQITDKFSACGNYNVSCNGNHIL